MGAWFGKRSGVSARTILLALVLAVLLWGVSEYRRVTREAERERARQAIDDCFANGLGQYCADTAKRLELDK